MEPLWMHVFLLVVYLGGEKQGDDMYFYNIDRCTYFAQQINLSMSQKPTNAYCIPKYMDVTDKTIKVYRQERKMDKTVSQKMQDELEPILHESTEEDESDRIEKEKRKDYILKPLHERGWKFNMETGPGAEF